MPNALKYRLICEGPSERAYVQQLSALLSNELPLMDDGYTPRLSFFPTVTNDKLGGGSFKLVKRAYKKLCPNDKTPLKIWVDCDIYIRNDGQNEQACAAGYAQKGTMPDFNFMVMNFEDFLAMHFPDDLFAAWKTEMQIPHHFTVPLHGDAYAPHFKKTWDRLYPTEGYRKGSLPAGFVSVESLQNMIRHTQDPTLSPLFARHAPAGAFPIFLADTLVKAYPNEFQIEILRIQTS